MNTNIDPEKYYSARFLSTNKILPITSLSSIVKLLESENGKAIFKPVVRPFPTMKRYLIKGANIIEALELINKGNTLI